MAGLCNEPAAWKYADYHALQFHVCCNHMCDCNNEVKLVEHESSLLTPKTDWQLWMVADIIRKTYHVKNFILCLIDSAVL